MSFLFVINSEVVRRSLAPVLDMFIEKGHLCRVLATPFSIKAMSSHSAHFIDQRNISEIKWRFVISANPLDRNIFKSRIAAVHHGSMFGNNSWSLKTAYNSDVFFGLSPYELPYIRRHLKNDFDDKLFIPSGNPANDRLVNFKEGTSFHQSEVRRRLGLNNKQKTILIGSHWTSLGNLRRFGTGLLDAVSWNYPNHQIICTCHPNLLKNPKVEFRIDKKVETPDFDSNWLIAALRSRQNDHVRIILNEATPAELLSISDVFIGDNSSMLAEASYFEIPLLASNENAYFDRPISDIVLSDVHPFKNIEGLLAGLEIAMGSDSSRIKVGERIRKLFMHNVGSATKTIYETLTAA